MTHHLQMDIQAQVTQALIEDLGGELTPSADVTAQLIGEDKHVKAKIITREDGVLCGQDWASESFKCLDSSIELNWLCKDSDLIAANQTIVEIKGSARVILTAERTALNFLQLLSGTATTAYKYSQILDGTKTKILDTRKTIPGLRLAQKYAVTCGGGSNHRIGLFDAYLIKENHIHACGGIAQAITKAKTLKPGMLVEVEVETLEELKEAVASGADIVMLDNFSNQQIQSAVAFNDGRCKLEVSGNITDDKLVELANFGVDYISSGALTKHVKALDLSLLIV